jgi:hypothetical protein
MNPGGLRRVVLGVLPIVALVGAIVTWAVLAHRPFSALIPVSTITLVVISTFLISRNMHLSRWLFAPALSLVGAGFLVIFLARSQAGWIAGWLVIEPGIAGSVLLFFVRASYNPYADSVGTPGVDVMADGDVV